MGSTNVINCAAENCSYSEECKTLTSETIWGCKKGKNRFDYKCPDCGSERFKTPDMIMWD